MLLPGDRIASCHTRRKYDVTEIGIMYPEQTSTGKLRSGQVGYIACNMKESTEGICLQPFQSAFVIDIYEAHVGDTFHKVGDSVQPFPGFMPAKAMVRALKAHFD